MSFERGQSHPRCISLQKSTSTTTSAALHFKVDYPARLKRSRHPQTLLEDGTLSLHPLFEATVQTWSHTLKSRHGQPLAHAPCNSTMPYLQPTPLASEIENLVHSNTNSLDPSNKMIPYAPEIPHRLSERSRKTAAVINLGFDHHKIMHQVRSYQNKIIHQEIIITPTSVRWSGGEPTYRHPLNGGQEAKEAKVMPLPHFSPQRQRRQQ